MKKVYLVCTLLLVIISTILVNHKIHVQKTKIAELEDLNTNYRSVNESQLVSNSHHLQVLINSMDDQYDHNQLSLLVSYLNNLSNESAAMSLNGNQSEMWKDMNLYFEHILKTIGEEKNLFEIRDFITTFDEEITYMDRTEGTLPLDSVKRIKDKAIKLYH
ncbi:hypothetical protein M3223_00780 [Paenibacillus pasadenensis]|uniref:hypothetical protein n=1 Tax=Paenibacillus pasadenensis TaxID=217090 RepID=UPI0020406479|nr:hypothetical protein [Paenibacillus pasadenensis]MCM3745878.1 hypothetical protein [Paenibacillus pasadenensis]